MKFVLPKRADLRGGDESRSRRLRGLIGFALGVLLFAAAIWAIASGGPDLRHGWDAARHAPWWLVAIILVLPVVNWLVVSWSFHVLQNRYGHVGRVEMAALIAGAWLLNYLPFKPGMVGRLAYHKSINGIRYKDSIRVLIIGVGLSAASIVVLIVIALLVRVTGPGWEWAWCLPVPAGLLVAMVWLHTQGDLAWRVALAALLRYVDTMVWIGRYAAAFALVDAPLDFETALLVAAVSQIALFIPLAGNGLGIREWGVRLATEPVGLLAEVINRAAELAVSLPVGLAGTLWVSRRLARAKAADAADPSPENGGHDPAGPAASASASPPEQGLSDGRRPRSDR